MAEAHLHRAAAAPARPGTLPDHDGWRSVLAALAEAEATLAAYRTPTGGER
ncbi:hypothetical protein [Ornithinimicrobium panacihumi]|uniref:hypothetical protein n=1 Tax=Ornithinimicrobium panacihumi TaxID=2008449 RepID=UPI003F8B572D